LGWKVGEASPSCKVLYARMKLVGEVFTEYPRATVATAVHKIDSDDPYGKQQIAHG